MLYVEHVHVVNIITEHHIMEYFRHVDTILISYSTRTTNISNNLMDFDSLQPQTNLNFERNTKQIELPN
jgi:hypothetical protein